jgi:hypothetical protein
MSDAQGGVEEAGRGGGRYIGGWRYVGVASSEARGRSLRVVGRKLLRG